MSKYLQGFISAPTANQADQILNDLLNKKLIAGGMISKAPAKYWWNKKIVKRNYYNISGFTKSNNKKQIIEVVKGISSDKAPLIWFSEIKANKEMCDWINEYV